MTVVRIYPPFNPHYYAFYIEGLREVFGAANLTYSVQEFGDADIGRQREGLAFLVRDSREIRGFIDAGDSAGLDDQTLEWADVYGMVNLDPSAVPSAQRHKIVPIGPSFGVRAWGVAASIMNAVGTYRVSRRRIRSWKAHLENYWAQWHRRLALSAYDPQLSSERYVFFAAWPWKKHPDVNPPRAQFIRICRSVEGLDFEGGFVPRRRRDLPDYEDITAPKRYPIAEYIEKIKRSAMVYNTPAVHGCLGWKLAEFLALGKAIISLPLTREMPAPLVHGKHVHFVDGSEEELRVAVEYLRDDLEYRRRLERGARTYYLDHLAPRKVVERLLHWPRRDASGSREEGGG